MSWKEEFPIERKERFAIYFYMTQQFLKHDFVFKTVKNQEASNKGHQGTTAEPVSMQENTLLIYIARGPHSEPIHFYFRLNSNTTGHLVAQQVRDSKLESGKDRKLLY